MSKIHLVVESGVSVNGKPPAWIAVCPVYTAEWMDPNGTTRDPDKATCKRCIRIIARQAHLASSQKEKNADE
jgi:hypothetical protein